MSRYAGKIYATEITPLSLCDYLGEPAIVIFFSGCNFNCGYCQNWKLKVHSEDHLVPFSKIADAVLKNKLVCACKVTGGEPLLQLEALLELANVAKKAGLKFGVDTNGSSPEALEKILPYCDLVSIDVKTSFDEKEYKKISGISAPIEKIKESLKIAISSKAFVDIRMVIIPGQNDSKQIAEDISNQLKALGYNPKAEKGLASFSVVEYLPENVNTDDYKKIQNTSRESLESFAAWLSLKNVHITHRAIGFYKKYKKREKN